MPGTSSLGQADLEVPWTETHSLPPAFVEIVTFDGRSQGMVSHSCRQSQTRNHCKYAGTTIAQHNH